jgi:hypothetical protein
MLDTPSAPITGVRRCLGCAAVPLDLLPCRHCQDATAFAGHLLLSFFSHMSKAPSEGHFTDRHSAPLSSATLLSPLAARDELALPRRSAAPPHELHRRRLHKLLLDLPWLAYCSFLHWAQ